VLFVKEAYFKRGPADAEIKVLGDCRLAEIFVPYNGGGPKRVYDISGHTFPLVPLDKTALGPACVKPGVIYKADGTKAAEGEKGPVAAEVHDGHIRWMNDADQLRRGQSLTVWAVLSGANYRYVMLYQFRDDGQVGFRIGATAHNLYNNDNDGTTHVHLGCWRINVELGDATKTKVSRVTLDTALAKSVTADLETETRIKWNAEEFTRLRVESTATTNGHSPNPKPIGYELLPVRMGSPRYTKLGEEFTQHDLWVTKQGTALTDLKPRDLHTTENGEALGADPVTLWHHSAVLHVARDEDFGKVGTNPGEGVAITAWAGCDLKPRNLFASTPLYP
jgi:Cu2+-containing amine oxidase